MRIEKAPKKGSYMFSMTLENQAGVQVTFSDYVENSDEAHELLTTAFNGIQAFEGPK